MKISPSFFFKRFVLSIQGISKDEEDFFALSKRRTDRFLFLKRSFEVSDKQDLKETVKKYGGMLHFIEGEKNLKTMGKIWGFHDDFYWANKMFLENFRELIHTDSQAMRLGTGFGLSMLGLGVIRFYKKSINISPYFFHQ